METPAASDKKAPVVRGDRGRGDSRGRGRGMRGRGQEEEKSWTPVTKLGRLVKDGKISSIEEIYLFSLPVKEYQIIDFFCPKLKVRIDSFNN